jgi:glycosyltransferase involved in cell wall biosynthesis
VSRDLTLSIVAPAYDEADCIERSVRSWLEMLDEHSIRGEVVVADDGSRDATPRILERLATEDRRVRFVRLDDNCGYGHALRAAIGAAQGELTVTIDADGQFDARDIPRLLARQREGDLDVVTGRRRRKNDSLLRVVADRGLNRVVRLLFPGLSLRDTNCALKLVRTSRLQSLPLRADGYPTPTEIVVRAHHAGLTMAELDVAHLERGGGSSKLRMLHTAIDSARFLIGLRAELR